MQFMRILSKLNQYTLQLNDRRGLSKITSQVPKSTMLSDSFDKLANKKLSNLESFAIQSFKL